MSKLKLTLKEPNIDYRLMDERGPTHEWKEKSREAPIVTAHNRGQINRAQYAAAQKFYAHWFKGGLCERYGSVDLCGVFGGENINTGMAKTELQAFHRHCHRKAVETVGKLRASILSEIICNEEPIVNIGHRMGWKKRETALGKALTHLRDALDILCKEWGLFET